MSQQAQACEFNWGGQHFSGLRWHEGKPNKVIALHGWLDNAASFSMLAPRLDSMDIVALDLAGHAQSGDRLGAGPYNIWEDLREIKHIASELGWARFSLLGHSRGAMIATLYAGTFPEHIERICLIDAVIPYTAAAGDLPKQLRKSILTTNHLAKKRSTYHADFDSAARMRTLGAFPLSDSAARILAERGVVKTDKGYCWRYDKKLLNASEIRFSDDQARAFVDSFPRVAKVILAESGLVHDKDLDWFNKHPKLDVIQLAGDHHLQLASEPEILNKLAKTLNDYFL